ncbi:MAG: hypothetical protein IPN95_17680 [Bacteroidetes bacterium]|nr:hypothetical protein [Bacteroidota bacterium]
MRSISSMNSTLQVILILLLLSGNACSDNHPPKNNSSKNENPSFQQQLDVFEDLGYRLNPGITPQDILTSALESGEAGAHPEDLFVANPYEELYYYLGWTKEGTREYFTNDCIWYDLEFIDPSEEYITFMQRMGAITHGEIEYSSRACFRVDDRNTNGSTLLSMVFQNHRNCNRSGISTTPFPAVFLSHCELKTKGRTLNMTTEDTNSSLTMPRKTSNGPSSRKRS